MRMSAPAWGCEFEFPSINLRSYAHLRPLENSRVVMLVVWWTRVGTLFLYPTHKCGVCRSCNIQLGDFRSNIIYVGRKRATKEHDVLIASVAIASFDDHHMHTEHFQHAFSGDHFWILLRAWLPHVQCRCVTSLILVTNSRTTCMRVPQKHSTKKKGGTIWHDMNPIR